MRKLLLTLILFSIFSAVQAYEGQPKVFRFVVGIGNLYNAEMDNIDPENFEVNKKEKVCYPKNKLKMKINRVIYELERAAPWSGFDNGYKTNNITDDFCSDLIGSSDFFFKENISGSKLMIAIHPHGSTFVYDLDEQKVNTEIVTRY